MVPPLGIEPSSTMLQTVAMTTSAKAANWGNQWGTIPYYQFHRLGCEPLHYGHRCLAPGVGIEPTIAESKSVVLPLHYPGINLAEAVRFELTDPFGSTVFKTVAINQARPRFLVW